MFDNYGSSFFSEHSVEAYFKIGQYLLECNISIPDELRYRIVTTQDFEISFKLSKSFGNAHSLKPIQEVNFVFYYSPPSSGWATPYLYEQASQKEISVLFNNRDNSKYYELQKPSSSDLLIDMWFQKLLQQAASGIDRKIFIIEIASQSLAMTQLRIITYNPSLITGKIPYFCQNFKK